MNFRFTITKKLGLGFGILTIAYMLNAWFTYVALEKSKNQNMEIITTYQPSVINLEKMYSMITESRLLLKNWAFIEKESATPDKLKFIETIELQLPFYEQNIIKIYHQWPQPDQIKFNNALSLLNDSLLVLQKRIIGSLNKPEAYNDKVILPEMQLMLKPDGQISSLTDKILTKLSVLLDNHQIKVKAAQGVMNESFENAKSLLITSSIIFIILVVVIAILTINSQVKPINYIKNILISMGKGVLPKNKIEVGNDEIGEISVALNSLVTGLKEISNFSMEIGKGNFNSEFSPLSDQDILGNSLIKMREELRNAVVEEEKRKKEDDQRNWATQGVAKFSEILRQNNDNINDLTYNIISNLVNYLEANQGGIFIVNDDMANETLLEMTGCYAYNRQKFLQKVFKPGEGLIGRCYQECSTIYLTDIPKDYIKITSGLGDDNPTSLLIVPLMYNDKVFGIVEIASFINIDTFQIEFVEKIGSSIASTISAVKINIQTTKLLEQSRQQAEEMASQEEEMRQNMEELRATQEESSRKETAMQKELKELKQKVKNLEK